MKIPVCIECVLLPAYWRILYRNSVPPLLSQAGSTGRAAPGLAAVEEADALLMLSRFSDLPLISEVLIRAHIFHIYNNNDTYTSYVTQKRRSILAVFEQILLAGTMETGGHE